MKSKSISKHSQKFSGVMLLLYIALTMAGCTKNFQEYNSNPNSLTDVQTLNLIPSAIGPLEQSIFSNYQVSQNLTADAYSGYMMSPTNFQGGNNTLKYYMVDGWNRTGFNDQYNQVMARVKKMVDAGIKTAAPEVWAVATLIQVEAMSRVTDRFGPIPYTQVGTSLTNIPYDDQKTVYQTFFNQLDTAVTTLNAFITGPSAGLNRLGSNDLIYAGNYAKWIKFANSLRLRLAMRIVKADAAMAKQQGEKALGDPGGLLSAPGSPNGDDASIAQSGTRDNDLWIVTILYKGDNHLNASIGTYLTGYNDPRTTVYAVPATYSAIAGATTGIRLGCDVTKTGTDNQTYGTFASYNCINTFTQKAPQLIMTAAEIWFLKAEAALRGWANAGDAKTNYETGVQTSMTQWGVGIGSYLSDNTSTQAGYVDPINADNNHDAMSTITIKWDDAVTNETKLERIITQKWLAIFPEGQEAWADYRRTGYPKLFPVVQNLSNSTNGGPISTDTQIRRLPYPAGEYQSNNAAVTAAVSNLLGGADNGGTRLWWDPAGVGNF